MSRPRASFLVAAFLMSLAAQRAWAEPPATTEVGRLIKQLGSEKFSEREAAAKRLEEIGEAALGPLRAAAAQRDDPEVRLRAMRLLVVIEGRLVALDRRRDYERLRGTWVAVAVQTEQQHLLLNSPQRPKLVATGEKIEIWNPGEKQPIPCQLDPHQNPKAIDVLQVQGAEGRVTLRGIYTLEGDTLSICLGPPDGERPKFMGAHGHSGNTRLIFQRVKKAKEPVRAAVP
jgi:uncharacterized protein (TIGR03067 family)